MPKNATQKKTIRDRMAATGEPYMEARRNVEDGAATPAKPASGAWIIQQGIADPMDSLPHEWVLHEDGTTHGFIDHGFLIGFLSDPDDRSSMEAVGKPITQEAAQSLVGCYPVTMSRFTGGWSTWTHPIETVTTADPKKNRERLYGGTRVDLNSWDRERSDLRAEADRRRLDPNALDGHIELEDGSLLDVDPGGVTREGLIADFVTVDAPMAVVSWAEVEDAIRDGLDLSRLAGMAVRVHPDDLTSPPRAVADGLVAEVRLTDED